MKPFVRVGAPALALIILLILVLAAGAGAAPSSRATLSGSVPSWATSASFKAAAPPTSPVNVRVYLGWRNAAQAEALARAVSDPRSASYRHYLTPAQFRQRFAPTQADVTAVKSWLTGQGFAIDYTPSNNLYVAAEGTVAQAENAFCVRLNLYTHEGLTLRAPATAVSVPASLAGTVTATVGLDQSAALVHPGATTDASPAPGYRNAEPLSAYWGEKLATTLPKAFGAFQPYAPKGYTPPQLQGAYGVANAIASGNDGHGVTVAIIDAFASPTILQDANQYAADNGQPTFKPGQFKELVAPGTYHHPEKGMKQDPQGWYGEETLDVEAVHSMAPGANILFAGTPNAQQKLLDPQDMALNHIVDRHLAQIVSNSYGWTGEDVPRGFIKPLNSIFIQAAAEGIGIYFSSGDSGDEIDTIGYRDADWPASSPWVTAVGGTSLGVGADNQYLFETGWGTGRNVLTDNAWDPAVLDQVWNPDPPSAWWYGGGGGTSRIFVQPWYQQSVVPTAISEYTSSTPMRAVPDVAAVGDPTTGMLVGQTQTWSDGSTSYDTYRVGGTSLSCPLFAGMMALADQKAGKAHGFANPALYAAANTAAYRDIVDPTSPIAAVRVDFVNGENASEGLTTTLRTMNFTETLHTIPGYDDVTGVGTPNGQAWLDALGQ
jgi:subtilase family serine protease